MNTEEQITDKINRLEDKINKLELIINTHEETLTIITNLPNERIIDVYKHFE